MARAEARVEQLTEGLRFIAGEYGVDRPEWRGLANEQVARAVLVGDKEPPNELSEPGEGAPDTGPGEADAREMPSQRVRMDLSDGAYMDVNVSPDASPETLAALRAVGEAAAEQIRNEDDAVVGVPAPPDTGEQT